MNQQQRMMRQLSSMKFAAWELHIFLDTHPETVKRPKSWKNTERKSLNSPANMKMLLGQFNETSNQASRWAWISGPWPWEVGEEEDD